MSRMVAPVYLGTRATPFGYVANRAHHADIGGSSPGSMALATEIYQEGLRIPPVHLVRGGRVVDDVRSLFLANTRVEAERLGDLNAQFVLARAGAGSESGSWSRVSARRRWRPRWRELQAYSARMVRRFITRIPRGRWSGRRLARRRRIRFRTARCARDGTNDGPTASASTSRNRRAGARARSTRISR